MNLTSVPPSNRSVVDGGGALSPGSMPDWDVLAPGEVTVPFVFASPHSGRMYSAEFLAASCLDIHMLRRSEDAFVDELFLNVPTHGAPLLRAHFPRTFVDANRDARELDPRMFEEPLPPDAFDNSPRAAAGYGVVARLVAGGTAIYSGKLRLDDVRRRISTLHAGYHKTLRQLVDQSRLRFGGCMLIDCHSMPSRGAIKDRDAHLRDVDIILGDCWGSSCDAVLSDTAERLLRDLGFSVGRNRPYAGGYTTRHYGAPGKATHAIQIEVNRALYMDEERIERTDRLPDLVIRLNRFIRRFVGMDWSRLVRT